MRNCLILSLLVVILLSNLIEAKHIRSRSGSVSHNKSGSRSLSHKKIVVVKKKIVVVKQPALSKKT